MYSMHVIGPLKDPHLKRQDFDKILSELDEPICPYCKRIFSSRGNLRRHMEIHIMSDRKRFQCDICLKKYKRKDYLKEHKMTVHSPNNKWKFLRIATDDYYKEVGISKAFNLKKKVEKVNDVFPLVGVNNHN
ncbi:hypothetical protein JTE90_008007 [Oedothorax gibbosus]|uniref:C2H2-type domain-containing protein n=1 Tax=Oedothorax gibbosus TaxID=931172 RepID=A0AAV6UVV1_9ARAC|nr:hypothetical protein JTE90_008007 [Oedothorax gibbosus]